MASSLPLILVTVVKAAEDLQVFEIMTAAFPAGNLVIYLQLVTRTANTSISILVNKKALLQIFLTPKRILKMCEAIDTSYAHHLHRPARFK